jgi:hypothetical protein
MSSLADVTLKDEICQHRHEWVTVKHFVHLTKMFVLSGIFWHLGIYSPALPPPQLGWNCSCAHATIRTIHEVCICISRDLGFLGGNIQAKYIGVHVFLNSQTPPLSRVEVIFPKNTWNFLTNFPEGEVRHEISEQAKPLKSVVNAPRHANT